MTKLPIDEMSVLLDKNGLKNTWRNLLFTYIRKSHSDKTGILEHNFFNDAELLNKDYLEGLTIGQKSLLYEFSLSYVDSHSRKNSGQYFTPDDVSELMAKQSLKFDEGVWLDPCSGVGNLSWWLINAQKDKKHFLLNDLIVADKDELAVFIARVLLNSDFGDVETFEKTVDKFIVNDFLDTVPEHDYVIMNPPYVVVKKDNRFESADTRDLYAYFIEQALKTSKGLISITPESFTNGKRFQSLRKIIQRQQGFQISCFDNMPASLFKGIKFGSTNTNMANSTRASIMIVGHQKEKHITPLLRWTADQREKLLQKLDNHYSILPENTDIFPKLSKELVELYGEIRNKPYLKNYLSKTKTDYPLFIPATPRYYTSAVKRELNRSSLRTIYFTNEEERDLFYPYLNSSVLYWWWRINDGGMSLSTETLLSLPVMMNFDDTAYENLVKELMKSETDNVVIKMNAGKPIENVKHPFALTEKLNKHYFPDYVDGLKKIHNNSSLI